MHARSEQRASEQPRTRAALLSGAGYGVFAVSIWAGWFVLTRVELIQGLTAYDIVALRFGVAGLILLPVLARWGFALEALGPWGLAAIVFGAGAPYALVASAGLLFAPAAHGAALTPGVMPLFVAGLSAIVLRETQPFRGKTGLALIATGIVCIGGVGMLAGDGRQSIGHGLFLAASFMWALYTVALKRSGLAPLHGTAIVAVCSLILYAPIYAVFLEPKIFSMPVRSLVFAAVYQGVLTSVVSLIAYNKAVQILGASRGAAFASLVPAMALLLAIPMLGETPTLAEGFGIALVSVGVYLAAGPKR